MVPKRLAKNAKLHRELAGGQEKIPEGVTGEHGGGMAIPIDGEKLEQLFAMIARGLIWYHWNIHLDKDYEVQVHTVTKAGEQFFDDLLFKKNTRARVHKNLKNGTFIYEGAQG